VSYIELIAELRHWRCYWLNEY